MRLKELFMVRVKVVEKEDADKYSMVEFFPVSCHIKYQFKIWNLEGMPLCVLVKKDSDLLRWIQVGETLTMQYYSNNPKLPTDCLPTTILEIAKNNKGRFKDHYLVALKIGEQD